MRLPNGYGSVYKLSVNRRNPWAVAVFVDTPNGRVRKIIGYCAAKEDGLQMLADYHKNPFTIETASITFSEVYAKWADEHFGKISASNIKGYQASYKCCTELYKIRMVDIRKTNLQHVIDTCGKNYPTLRKLQVLFSQLFKFALENDICVRDYSQFVDIAQYKDKNPDAINRQPFSAAEIDRLWSAADTDNYTIKLLLCMIYSGARIGELYELKKKNVHLGERWFYIEKSKTPAGIREVPIAEKVYPLWEQCMARQSDYVFCNAQGNKFMDRTFRDSYWNPLMDQLNMTHLPHDARHTCVSMLTNAGVDERMIKKIVGHAGQSVTENVYTHLEMPEKLKAINLI